MHIRLYINVLDRFRVIFSPPYQAKYRRTTVRNPYKTSCVSRKNASSRISVVRKIYLRCTYRSPAFGTVVSRQFIHVVRAIEPLAFTRKKKLHRWKVFGTIIRRAMKAQVYRVKKNLIDMHWAKTTFVFVTVHLALRTVCCRANRTRVEWIDVVAGSQRGLFGETNLLRFGVGGQFVSRNNEGGVSFGCVCVCVLINNDDVTSRFLSLFYVRYCQYRAPAEESMNHHRRSVFFFIPWSMEKSRDSFYSLLIYRPSGCVVVTLLVSPWKNTRLSFPSHRTTRVHPRAGSQGIFWFRAEFSVRVVCFSRPKIWRLVLGLSEYLTKTNRAEQK